MPTVTPAITTPAVTTTTPVVPTNYRNHFAPTVPFNDYSLTSNGKPNPVFNAEAYKEFQLLMNSNLSQGEVMILLIMTLMQALQNRKDARDLTAQQAELALKLGLGAAEKQRSAGMKQMWAEIVGSAIAIVGNSVDAAGQMYGLYKIKTNPDLVNLDARAKALFPDAEFQEPKFSGLTGGAQPKTGNPAALDLDGDFKVDLGSGATAGGTTNTTISKSMAAQSGNLDGGVDKVDDGLTSEGPPNYDDLFQDETFIANQRDAYNRLQAERADGQLAASPDFADTDEEKIDLGQPTLEAAPLPSQRGFDLKNRDKLRGLMQLDTDSAAQDKIDLADDDIDLALFEADPTGTQAGAKARVNDAERVDAQIEADVNRSDAATATAQELTPEQKEQRDAMKKDFDRANNATQIARDNWKASEVHRITSEYDRYSRLATAWGQIISAIGRCAGAVIHQAANQDSVESTTMHAYSQFAAGKERVDAEFAAQQQQLLASVLEAVASMNNTRHHALSGIWV